MGIDQVAPPPRRRAVFLDRDGVLNAAVVRDGRPYPPRSVAEFQLLPGVRAACAQLHADGFLLVVATNQPDVGRGTQERAVVEEMHRHLCAELPIDQVEVCYHPGGPVVCACRKPAPGMLLQASAALGIDLAASYMVGDRWRDVDCGAAAGCRTVFIDRGYAETLRAQPTFTAVDLPSAAAWILAGEKH